MVKELHKKRKIISNSPSITETVLNLEDYVYTKYPTFMKLSNQFNINIYNFYDEIGRCVLEMDNEGKTISREYYGYTSNIASQSKLSNNIEIPIQNNSFELGNLNNISGWDLIKGNSSYVQNDSYGKYGRCLKVIKNEDEEVKLTQDILLEAGQTYSLGLVAKYSNLNEGDFKIILKGSYVLDEEINFQVINNIVSGSSNSWSLIKTNSISIPDDATQIKATIEISITGSEKHILYLDEVNVTSLDRISRSNLLKNPYFQFVENNKPKDWILVNDNNLDVVKNNKMFDNEIELGNKYMEFNNEGIVKISESEETKKMYQTINYKGSQGDKYTLSILTQAYASFNDIYKAYVRFNYDDGTNDITEYDFIKDCKSIQILNKIVVAKKVYTSIEVGVEYKGKNTAVFDNIQLLKGGNIDYYYCDNRGNIVEISDRYGSSINMIYNNDNQIELSTMPDGTTIRYEYENNKLKTIKNNKGVNVIYTYEGDNLISQNISYDNVSFNSEYNYDSRGNQIYYKNEYNNEYQRTYDIFRRITTETNPKGLVINYSYDNFNNLLTKSTTLNGQSLTNTFTYNNLNNVKKVESLNGSKYEFGYDNYGNLLTVKMNGIILNTFTYKTINNYQTNIISNKIYGNNSDVYIFDYDSMNRLISIKNKTKLIAQYTYDENNNISSIFDAVNQYMQYFTYDIENKITRITTNKGTETDVYYDNRNNINKINRKLNGKIKSTEFNYEYEINDYSFESYVNRLAQTYRDEVFSGTQNGDGRNGAIQYNGLFTATPIIDEDGIYVYPLRKCQDYFKISAFDLNRGVKNAVLYGVPYNSVEFYNKYKTTKSFVIWMKPKTQFQNMELLQSRNVLTGAYIEDIRLTINNNGKIALSDKRGHVEEKYETTKSLKLNEWNLVIFKVKDDKAYLYVNGEQLYLPELEGTNYSLQAMELFYSIPNNYNENLLMPIDIAFMSIGCYDYTSNDVLRIYQEGLKYLSINTINNKQNITRYTYGTFENNYNIVSLNGVLESNKNHKPVVLEKANTLYSSDNNNVFYYDEELGRYVFSSFNILNSADKIESKLGYDLGIEEEGVISIKFKMSGICENSRYILNSLYENSQRLALYVRNNLLKLKVNDMFVDIDEVEFLNDKWYTITLFINKDENNNTILRIYVNDIKKVEKTLNAFNLIKTITYIGRNVEIIDSVLNGYLEKFIWKTTAISEENQLNEAIMFTNSTYLVEHIHNIDKIGRINNKIIKTSDYILYQTYSYYKNRVISEYIPYIGERKYIYDEEGNIIFIDKSLDGTSGIQYEYDKLNRLIFVNDETREVNMYYDNNGNITSRVERSLLDPAIEKIEYYTYDTTHKDRLVYFHNPITGEAVELIYGAGHNPVRLIENNSKVNAIVYEGKRIIQYGNNTYKYNEEGIRVYKKEPVYNNSGAIIGYNIHNYVVEGEKVLTETIQTVKHGQIRFDYNYDITGDLVSVEFQNQIYFYIKDVLGIIHSLVDRNGNVMVNYEYDEWGKLTSINATNPNHPLVVYNPYIYKSYYYDYESKMYYLNNRYYNPLLKRFITIDDINYLDVNTLGNLNLYTYCYNNPIMYYDPDGHKPKWWQWLISGLEVAAGIALCFVPGAQGWGVTLIGTCVGSMVNGYINESKGDSFDAGWWGGQAGGLISVIPGIGIPLGAFVGSTITDGIDYGWDGIDWNKALVTSFVAWGFSLFPGMTGEILSKYKIYDKAIYFVNAYNTILTSTANSIVNVYWRGKNIEKRSYKI